MDGLTKEKLEKMNENRVLDNKHITDEVYNLTQCIARLFQYTCQRIEKTYYGC